VSRESREEISRCRIRRKEVVRGEAGHTEEKTGGWRESEKESR